MSARKKSNVLAWVWAVGAFSTAVACGALLPWALDAFGFHKQLWTFIFGAGICGVFLLMIRVAKSYDEDDLPVETPVLKSPAEKRNARLSTMFWIIGLTVVLASACWSDFAASPLPQAAEEILWWVGFSMFMLAGLIGRKRGHKFPAIHPASAQVAN